jgi:hydrogenase maturation protease
VVVIGCGATNRTDDGVGIAVIRRLAPRDGLRVFDAGTDGMAVMFAARGCTTLVVIDACTTGAEPGTVFEVPASKIQAQGAPSFALQGFRWEHAIYSGRKIYGVEFPADLTVLLVEARSLGIGLSLSAPVEAAARQLVVRLDNLVADRLGVSG